MEGLSAPPPRLGGATEASWSCAGSPELLAAESANLLNTILVSPAPPSTGKKCASEH